MRWRALRHRSNVLTLCTLAMNSNCILTHQPSASLLNVHQKPPNQPQAPAAHLPPILCMPPRGRRPAAPPPATRAAAPATAGTGSPCWRCVRCAPGGRTAAAQGCRGGGGRMSEGVRHSVQGSAQQGTARTMQIKEPVVIRKRASPAHLHDAQVHALKGAQGARHGAHADGPLRQARRQGG